MSTTNEKMIELLIKIEKSIENNNNILNQVCIILQNDRNMMWKVIIFVIGGAFAIIGVKLAFP